MAMDSGEGRGLPAADKTLVYDAVIAVSQVPPMGGIWGMMTCITLGMMGWVTLTVPSLEWGDGDLSWWMRLVWLIYMILLVSLSVVSMAAGGMLWYVIETRWQAWRKTTPFEATTRVRMDDHGLLIEGLGEMGWQNVLELEGIPDSSAALIVYTSRFKGVLLKAAHDDVLPVLQHHMAAHAQRNRMKLLEQGPEAGYAFKAMVFNWRGFLSWIWLGYLMAGAVAVEILQDARKDPFTNGLVALVLSVMVAGLIRAVPLFQLGTLGGKRMRAFVLKGCELTPAGHASPVDLHGARITRRNRAGLGYQIDFFSIRPSRGRGWDLMADSQVMATLMYMFRKLPVEFVDERQVLWERDMAP